MMSEEANMYITYEIPPLEHDVDDSAILREYVKIAGLLSSGWVFRGQACAEWPIRSSLEQETQRMGTISKDRYEGDTLKQIKLVSSSYRKCRELEVKDNLCWLALLQHHGCRTRLVDFTESFYIALYFAIRDLPYEKESGIEGVSAVWAIRKGALDSEMSRLNPDVNLSGEARRLINEATERSEHYTYDNYFDVPDGPLAVVHCKPDNLNPRMNAQQGLFLAPLNITETFEKNLTNCLKLPSMDAPTECKDWEEFRKAERQAKVIKICVRSSKLELQHRNLLHHLKRMNLSEETLFPGFDGFARSLNFHAAKWEQWD